jgi:hypothetical protein
MLAMQSSNFQVNRLLTTHLQVWIVQKEDGQVQADCPEESYLGCDGNVALAPIVLQETRLCIFVVGLRNKGWFEGEVHPELS